MEQQKLASVPTPFNSLNEQAGGDGIEEAKFHCYVRVHQKIDPETGEPTLGFRLEGLPTDLEHYCDNCHKHEILMVLEGDEKGTCH